MREGALQEHLGSEELETVVLQGHHKLAMRSLFNYHDFMVKQMRFYLNPVDQEKLEMARFQIENNLPIRTDLLYQVAPDFFQMELAEMEEAQRRRILNEKIRFLEVRVTSPKMET